MTKYLLILACMIGLFSSQSRFLHWKTDERLTWDDFQGPADMSTEMLAHTTSRINYNWQCEGGMFLVEVEAVFDREKSWKKELLTDKLLAHEQLHFDITELFSRRLRKVFADLEDGCALQAEEIKEIGTTVRNQWKAEQDLYDLESDHGRDEEGQQLWEKKVQSGLEELAEFESD